MTLSAFARTDRIRFAAEVRASIPWESQALGSTNVAFDGISTALPEKKPNIEAVDPQAFGAFIMVETSHPVE